MNTDKNFSVKTVDQDHASAIKNALDKYTTLLFWAKDAARNNLGWPDSVIDEYFEEDDEALAMVADFVKRSA